MSEQQVQMTQSTVALRIERCRLVALASLCGAPVLASVIQAVHQHDVRTAAIVVLFSVLIGVLLACVARSWRRAFLIYFPLLISTWFFSSYTIMFGNVPGRTIAIVLAGTSWEEAYGFLQVNHATVAMPATVLLIATYLWLSLGLTPKPIVFQASLVRRIGVGKILLLALLPIAAYGAFAPTDFIDESMQVPALGSLAFLARDLPMARAELAGAMVHKVPYGARRSGNEEVHILVVGESVRRDSWSAYGYARQTTPYLQQLQGAVVLTNVLADANLTSWSVPMILTGETPEQLPSVPIRGNLLDLAKEAGYQTAWLVNQDLAISTYVGVRADRLVYATKGGEKVDGTDTLDESLLPAYKNELGRSGRPRFIGIHIMGSHSVYDHRYPRGFARFVTDPSSSDPRASRPNRFKLSLLNAYDNSLLYTDWLLQQMLEQAKALKVPVTLTYVPDHGEELEWLDGRMGHGATVYTPHAFEIPAFVWTNDAYETAHPDKIEDLKRNASKVIRSHDFFYTVADLMGITWSQEPTNRSFASDQFAPDTQMPFAAGGVLVKNQQ
jgi:glucan phosphoethanolaminetransferase (alkaline phosphatase superfamily)